MNRDLVIVAIVFAILASLYFINPQAETATVSSAAKKFASYEELQNFLKTRTESYGYFGYGALTKSTMVQTAAAGPAAAEASGATGAAPSTDYSTTNIQVAGVDEADIVKNDGKYIYTVAGNDIVIIDAYPTDSAKMVSKIELNGTPNELFVNGNKLVVFEQGGYDYSIMKSGMGVAEIGIVRPTYYTQKTLIKVYDITDKANPVLTRNISLDGNYYNSRMIGSYVYAIINTPVYFSEPGPIPLPAIKSNARDISIPATDIYYFDFPDSSYIYTNVLAINTQDDSEEVSSKTFLMGYSQSMYVSPSNIYVTYTKRLSELDFYDRIVDNVIIPNVPIDTVGKIRDVQSSNISVYEKMQKIGDIFQSYITSLNPEEAASVMKSIDTAMQKVQQDIAKEIEKTVIHKISISGKDISYKTNGEVPGNVLNQFSMDEFNGYFRIATTTGNWQAQSANHVYVLDDNLKIVGKLEDLASGERIYSVRFLGDKGYMVTFRQVDPLFVIDLSNPSSPQVLGYLKIPGVSDYIHPYDETHVIGVGRDATDEGRIKGMKLSLFDVSNVSNPTEISKYYIGERGTDSEALYDHKAFLFSKEKNLLVIPVRLSEGGKWNVFQGAYVFSIDLTNGFALKGNVTHANETAIKEDPYYYDYQAIVRRSLYIDNALYTISQRYVKMNSLENVTELNKVELPVAASVYPIVEGVVATR